MSLRPVIENTEQLETWIWSARLTPDEVAELGRYKAEASGPSLVIVRGQIFSQDHRTLTLDPDRLVVLSIGDEPTTLFMEVSHEVADSFFNRHRGARRLYPETDERQQARQHQRERHEVRRERHRDRNRARRDRHSERNDARRAAYQARNHARRELRHAARHIEKNVERWGRHVERAVGPEFGQRIEREVRRAVKSALRAANDRRNDRYRDYA